jgi:hypothetical protein
LSPAGLEAEDRYQAALTESRERGGRTAFDELTAVWAASAGVNPGDGLYLQELKAANRTLPEIAESLEASGNSRSEAKAAIDRLLKAKLAEPLPLG